MSDAPTTLPNAPKWSWPVWSIWCIVIAGTYLFVLWEKLQEDPEFNIFLVVISSPVAATLYYGPYFAVRRWVFRAVDLQIKSRNITIKAESLQDELDKDFFTTLVRINFAYLEKYYLQTQQQGDKSFYLCLFAAIVGLVIITAGIVLMFLGKINPAYVTTAAGVLSEFVAEVFFYLYNKTMASMAEYHQKLVITQNIALALKITGELPQEDRVRSQMSLVEALTKDINHLLSRQILPEKA